VEELVLLLSAALALAAADPPAAPAPTPEPAPAAVESAVESAVEAAVEAAPPAGPPTWAVGLELGLDVPTAQRLPMASTRLDVLARLATIDAFQAHAGLRLGYSYAAGKGAVVDDTLGQDPAAFVMAHRVPLRVEGRLALRAPHLAGLGTSAVGVVGSAGADMLSLQARAFGRTGSVTNVTPGFSVGGFCETAVSDRVSVGLLGEWDSATFDLASTTPGVSGDFSAARVALTFSFALGG
jgi:hypothetical protein